MSGEIWCSGTPQSNWESIKSNVGMLPYKIHNTMSSPVWWNDVSVTLADSAFAVSSTGAVIEVGASGLGLLAGPEGGPVGFIAGNRFFVVVLNPIESGLSWGSAATTVTSDFLAKNNVISYQEDKLEITIAETSATSLFLSTAGQATFLGLADAGIDAIGSQYAHNPQGGIFTMLGLLGQKINMGFITINLGNR